MLQYKTKTVKPWHPSGTGNFNPSTSLRTGNLTVESLQDTDQYKDKQKSAGISVSIPIGAGGYGGSISASNSNTQSNYASVNEQSGIMAGDGGFQVNVNGNTDLKGAVIASTDKAIQDNRNSLTTETLTTSNIKNKAEYDASSTSLGGGYSASGDGVGLDQDGKAQTGGAQVPGTTLPSLKGFSATLPVALSASDKADSTTVSGVSHGNINVTNSTAQTTLTGKDAATTVATLNQDVKVVQSTDAEGNTTAIAVDSQGNNLANTLTPIFDDAKKAEINAGFEITQAFTQQVGTFLSNRAKESAEATKAIENELKKPESQQDINVITQAGQVIANNQLWAMGGTGRIALTAITAAFSGNVTGSGTSLIQSATVATLQSLGAQQIKAIADQIGGEGSIAHTALHAVLACAGAAATGGDCGTGALAASSGVVINKLLDGIEGKDNANLTATEKEARLNLISTLVTGVTAAVGGDAAVANTAVTIETENNALIKGAKAAIKTTKAAIDSYKKNGKVKMADLKQTLKDEGLSIADNLLTLADGELTVDDALAILDLVVGTEFNKANKGEALKKIEQIVERNKNALPYGQKYWTPPKLDEITGFTGLERATWKTPVQGGGGLRPRWKDSDGNIYEFDKQHGALEKYNSNGKHLGEFNYKTGTQTKPADPTRKVKP